jgi:hypothetical protein
LARINGGRRASGHLEGSSGYSTGPPPLGVLWTCALVFFGSWLATPRCAQAQPGDGINVGTGRLHPLAELEAHLVDNPAYAPPGDGSRDTYLVGRGGFELTLPSSNMELELRSALEWHEYLGLYDTATNELSDWGGEARVAATFNKGSALVLRLSNDLVRHADPSSAVVTGVGTTSGDTVIYTEPRTVNTLRLGFDAKPGGGALILTVEYGSMVDWAAPGSRSVRHMPELRATWKFLPKTALMLQTNGTMLQYPFGDEYVGNTARNPTTAVSQTYVGLIGDLTAKLSVIIKGGYSLVITEGGFLHGIVGQGELGYRATMTQVAKLGYARVYEPTDFYQFYNANRMYGRYEHLLFGSTQVALEASFVDFAYGPPIGEQTPGGFPAIAGRRDQLILADVSVLHNFNTWLFVMAQNRYEQRLSTDTDQPRSNYSRDDLSFKVGFKY